jgi:hypothetical protein
VSLARAGSLPVERALLPLVDEADHQDARKTIIDQKPTGPISFRATAHGNRKAISRSNRMNRMATR